MAELARDTLVRLAQRSQERLEYHFDRWGREPPGSDRRPTPADLFGAVRDLTLRKGKRLRPALAFHAALCIEHSLDEAVLFDACLSLELLQSALLIHDDIMDQDDERRGGPTVHVMMQRLAGDAHLGDSLGILAGSLGLALAQRLLVEAGLPNEAVVAGLSELVAMQCLVIYGQHFDLIGGAAPRVVQDFKTTSYTTRGPVRLGARIAGASDAQLHALEAYATPFGRAFQTRDDLLGTFGDPRRLGKPVGADLRAGRRTELVLLALERANAEQHARVEAVLGRAEASEEAVTSAVAAIEATGARAELEALVRAETGAAVAALAQAPLLPRGAEVLAGLAALLADRVS